MIKLTLISQHTLSNSSSFVIKPFPLARLHPTNERKGKLSPKANLKVSKKHNKKTFKVNLRKKNMKNAIYLLVASVLKTDDFGLVTLFKTLSTIKRRLNRVILLLLSRETFASARIDFYEYF